MCSTLTYDQGKEMARHEELAKRLKIKVYFCDPRSPWQRPSNGNTNGLIRQYLPKGINLSIYSQSGLNKIAQSLNTRCGVSSKATARARSEEAQMHLPWHLP
jgi:transposase, IS30 family